MAALVRNALLLILLVQAAKGQSYVFRAYGSEDGLSNLATLSLFQDATGFIWAGTENGIFRFDGSRWREMPVHKAVSLPPIQEFAQTTDGSVWARSTSLLLRWHGNAFEVVPLPVGVTIGWGRKLTATSDGRLRIASRQGLLEAKRTAAQWSFHLDPRTAGRSVEALRAMPDGKLLFVMGKQVWSLEGADDLKRLPFDHADYRSLHGDSSGRVWARSDSDLRVWNPRSSTSRVAIPLPESAQGGGDLVVDPQDRVLLTSSNGLVVYDPARHQLDLITKKRGLLGEEVNDVLAASDGSLWIAVGGIGVLRWLGRDCWTGYVPTPPLESTTIWAIRKESSGRYLLGTNDGVYRLRLTEQSPDSAIDPHPQAQPRFTDDGVTWERVDAIPRIPVRGIVRTADGTIWLDAGYPGVLYRLRSGDRQVVALGVESGLRGSIGGLFVDASGTLLVGTSEGLHRKHPHEDRFDRIPMRGPGIGPAVYAIGEGRPGEYVVTTRDGLFRRRHGQWTHYGRDAGLRDEWLGQVAVSPSDPDTVWVAYVNNLGLTRLQLQNDRVDAQHVGTADGLPSNMSFFLGFDSAGVLWNGTDRGVGFFDGMNWQIRTREDGLIWDDVSESAFLAEAGSVWIGTSHGLARHQVHHSDAPTAPPPVVFSQLLVGEEERDPRSAVYLHPQSAALQITFAALRYEYRNGLRYRYRFSDSATGWTETAENRIVLHDLPAGQHKLQVAAGSSVTDWSADPAELTIVVEAPMWARPWSVAMVLLALMAIGASVGYSQRRRALRLRHELELAVQERTRELEHARTRAETERARALEANRLKGEFLANMSHEIRTPMNGIMGMTHLAMMTAASAEQRDYLEHAYVSAEGLLGLLNDILDLSKIEADQMELDEVPFVARRMAERLLSVQRSRAQDKGLYLRCECEEGVPAVLHGDDHRISQILLNLVSNAIKFTHRGGVTVRGKWCPQGSDSGEMEFCVEDTGVGIPADKLAVVFDAFRQADGSVSREYGGTGLGLAISCKLTQLLRGRIWVESTVGVGSRFYLRVPLRVAADASLSRLTAQVNDTSSTASPRSLRVLVAEDNPVNQKLADRFLRHLGHIPVVVGDGAQALERLQLETFDVALIDIQMPVLDGMATVSAWRSREAGSGQRLPLVALTANAMKGDRERYLEHGMDDYLAKPFTPAQLREVLRRVSADDIHGAAGAITAESLEEESRATQAIESTTASAAG
jgi:signal transduction histidine kinase/CheY-like chemotaxis protein/ligand-binding sensor domain-containing protein